jgi:hypothetical protein
MTAYRTSCDVERDLSRDVMTFNPSRDSNVRILEGVSSNEARRVVSAAV